MNVRMLKRFTLMAILLSSCIMAQVYALSTDSAFTSLSKNLYSTVQKHNLQDIAILPFLANGQMSSNISEELRDLTLEKLSDYPDLDIYDRNELRLVATESSISCPEGMASGASAFLVAEIFYAEGDPVGYLSYRLIQTSDSRILSTGFVKLDWDESQRTLVNGAKRTLKPNQLPLIPEKEAKIVARKTSRIQDNLAMVYDGSDGKDNTLAARIAFAQVQAWLVESGHAVFEREFFRNVATEQSLNDDVAHSGDNITTVGHIKIKKKDDSANRVTLQFFALSNHKNLSTFTLVQNITSEIIANKQGDDGENALILRRKNRINAQDESIAGVNFVMHFEYALSDVLSEEQMEIIEREIDAASDEIRLKYPDMKESDQIAYIKANTYFTVYNLIEEQLQQDVAHELRVEQIKIGTRRALAPFSSAIREALELLSHEQAGYSIRTKSFDYLEVHDSDGVVVKRTFDWSNGVPCKISIDLDFNKHGGKLKNFLRSKGNIN